MPYFPGFRPRFLEPLEEFPLVVPFPEAHLLSRYVCFPLHSLQCQIANSRLSEPGALGLFNETPSTIDISLPTPNIPVFSMFTE
jgi:hypothetical protein